MIACRVVCNRGGKLGRVVSRPVERGPWREGEGERAPTGAGPAALAVLREAGQALTAPEMNARLAGWSLPTVRMALKRLASRSDFFRETHPAPLARPDVACSGWG
jgi:hypothetical protein